MEHKKLGQILIENGHITQYQIEQALKLQQDSELMLGKILVSQGWLTEEIVSRTVSKQLDISYVDLTNTLCNQNVIQLVPRELAIKHNILPLFIQKNTVYVAVEDPLNTKMLERLEIQLGMPVQPLIAQPGQLHDVIRKHYDVEQYIGKMLDHVEEDALAIDQIQQFIQKSQIIKLVNLLLSNSVKKQAHEIHIAPSTDSVHVRCYNVNGGLERNIRIPKWLHYPLTARLKVMAFLDITETEASQTGHIKAAYDKKRFDLHLTTLPTSDGEKIIIQIQSKTCRKCGADLEEDWKLCPYCGEPIPVPLPPTAQIAPEKLALRIVVADDDSSVRDMIKVILERRGYQVIPAADGEDALTKIRAELPDLAILDFSMPKRGGFSVCQAIRKTVDTMFTPVVILTTEDSMEERLEGITAGVDDYITKPFEVQEFLTRVESVLQQSNSSL
jgi:CheY-like chemotaxis protein